MAQLSHQYCTKRFGVRAVSGGGVWLIWIRLVLKIKRYQLLAGPSDHFDTRIQNSVNILRVKRSMRPIHEAEWHRSWNSVLQTCRLHKSNIYENALINMVLFYYIQNKCKSLVST